MSVTHSIVRGFLSRNKGEIKEKTKKKTKNYAYAITVEGEIHISTKPRRTLLYALHNTHLLFLFSVSFDVKILMRRSVRDMQNCNVNLFRFIHQYRNKLCKF